MLEQAAPAGMGCSGRHQTHRRPHWQPDARGRPSRRHRYPANRYRTDTEPLQTGAAAWTPPPV